MRTLNADDEKMLGRLRLPPEQKTTLQEVWSYRPSDPEYNADRMRKVAIIYRVQLCMIAAIVFGKFYPHYRWLADVSALIIWILPVIMIPLLCYGQLKMIRQIFENKQEKILLKQRFFIPMQIRKSKIPKRMITILAFVASLSWAGYTITPLAFIVGFAVSYYFAQAQDAIILKNLNNVTQKRIAYETQH